jgi:hypothetical protein
MISNHCCSNFKSPDSNSEELNHQGHSDINSMRISRLKSGYPSREYVSWISEASTTRPVVRSQIRPLLMSRIHVARIGYLLNTINTHYFDQEDEVLVSSSPFAFLCRQRFYAGLIMLNSSSNYCRLVVKSS